MSNFTGVTFAQQKVLPSDDAIIRRASLSDGVLYGCEISYSGSTLTMGAGQLLICGRQIRHPAAGNWAIVDATSGFARLVLTVDLTKTSSKDNFEQVVDSIEYATSQDGFPELVREDVNVSGTRYQVVACVVSLGTGGITGIVNQLGPVEGGGGGLNFKVVGGTTQPGNPTENTIWVETNVDITGWIFSATEPEAPADGKDGPVWITTGTSSLTTFNALKKNGIQVYPISAKQYIGGAWVDKIAKSYQNGAWCEWMYIILGNGKAVIEDFKVTTAGYGGSASLSGDTLTLITNEGFSDNGASILALYKKTSFHGYKTLEATYTISDARGTHFEIGIASAESSTELNVTKKTVAGSTGSFKVICDISEADEGYVGVRFYTDANQGTRAVYVTDWKLY